MKEAPLLLDYYESKCTQEFVFEDASWNLDNTSDFNLSYGYMAMLYPMGKYE